MEEETPKSEEPNQEAKTEGEPKVTYRPDGRKIYEYPDGSRRMEFPNGRAVRIPPRGVVKGIINKILGKSS